MNREIKFRGKHINTGEWIYGSLVNIEEASYAILPIINSMRGETIAMYEVFPETIGQFTGLQDKNGKAVYEGDILHVVEYNNKATMIFKDGEIQELELSLDEVRGEIVSEWHGTVECDESCMIVGNRYLDALFGDMRYSQPIFEFEVVGNIHDDHLLIDE